LGLKSFPCVGCKKTLYPADAQPAHALPQYGLLITQDVNSPEGFQREWDAKRGAGPPIHLIVQYYIDSDARRQAELDKCLEKNIECKAVQNIHVLLEKESDKPLQFDDVSKVTYHVLGKRMTFSDAFTYCNTYLDGKVCILANSDVYFDHSLSYLHRLSLRGKLFALTRVDEEKDGSYIFNEWTAPVCQDAWIFQSPVPQKLIDKTHFNLGVPGCDNHLAWLFRELSYHILNPSLKLISRHLHSSEKRNLVAGDKVEGEYMPVPPSGDI